jgi:hypothetical protein
MLRKTDVNVKSTKGEQRHVLEETCGSFDRQNLARAMDHVTIVCMWACVELKHKMETRCRHG